MLDSCTKHHYRLGPRGLLLVTCRSRVICKKRRVTERHNRGTKRKLKSHPPPQKKERIVFFCAWRDFNFRFVPRLCRSVTRLFCK